MRPIIRLGRCVRFVMNDNTYESDAHCCNNIRFICHTLKMAVKISILLAVLVLTGSYCLEITVTLLLYIGGGTIPIFRCNIMLILVCIPNKTATVRNDIFYFEQKCDLFF